MSQVVKALKEFEHEGVVVRLGEEIVVRSREGEELKKKGFITPVDRELDPKVKKDKDLMDKCQKRAEDRHATLQGDAAARTEEKNKKEAEKDAVRAEKLEETKAAFAAAEVTEPEGIDGMSVEELETAQKDLVTPPVPEEEDEEEAPAPAKVTRKRTAS